MVRALVVVSFATGCGFGFGAVDGPSKEYANFADDGAYYRDSSGDRVDSGGQRWSRGAGTFLGNAELGWGASLGYRRGIAFTHSETGASVDGGRSSDIYFQSYWGALSLGVGLTSESGTVESAPGQTAEVGYEGLYLEPGYALYANGPLYLGAVLAIIDGEATGERDYVEATGLRPGLRLGLTTIPLGPTMLRLTVDARYLITPAGDASGAYGGLSTAFALNVIL